MVTNPIVLETGGRPRATSANAFSVHPMGRKIDSVLNVTVIPDDVSAKQPELSEWTIDEERGSVPNALWNPEKPTLSPSEPSAKLIADSSPESNGSSRRQENSAHVPSLRRLSGFRSKRVRLSKRTQRRVAVRHSFAKYSAGTGPKTGRTGEDRRRVGCGRLFFVMATRAGDSLP